MVKFIRPSQNDFPKVPYEKTDINGFIKAIEKKITKLRRERFNEIDEFRLLQMGKKLDKLICIRDEFKKIRDL